MPRREINPLLCLDKLPAFGSIRAEHVEPAMDILFAKNRAALTERLASGPPFTWNNLIEPIERNEDRLSRAWSPVNHLHAVADNEALRAAYWAAIPKLTDYATELGQNEDLYRAYRGIADGPEYASFTPAQRKTIDNALRDFRLSGIELAAGPRERFKSIRQQLSELQTRFEENVLDATQGWIKHVTDPYELRGLPPTARALAKENARQRGLTGWVLTLEYPSYLPVLEYAESGELRREMYEAYVTRASDQGPNAGRWDNGGLMLQILALRREQAQLLGFRSYASLSLARKMARQPVEVLQFLRDLAGRSKPVAAAELNELERFGRERCDLASMNAWDIAFCAERLREQRHGFSQEELRPYFPIEQVLKGLFDIARRLYGIHIRERTGVEVWHPDVHFYELAGKEEEPRACFYLDLYARRHKRGGAWMDECRSRRRDAGGLQRPVAYLTCNFTPPVGDEPALLAHDEVVTLFHEFGHGLHHMLTRVDHPPVAGINGVPWDAVELPSQFMENWCWERESLDLIARHYQTRAPLPQPLLEKMRGARHFQSGMQMVRQIEFALFDFRLHDEQRGADLADLQALLDEVRGEVAVVFPPAFNRFPHSFGHIFAGGYAAGYYGYKWAEVLSADAFSKFEENGILDENTGRQFMRSILEQGGSRDPMDLFIEFRGRPPSIEPLLRHSGISRPNSGVHS
ncbi:MAG: M3 family metallopeptidase [Gammaproteobacteria bacterium]|nr:M3 family metallopeptidase [Gammaproteobacteria bacterium]